jgi:hypothetical protein
MVHRVERPAFGVASTKSLIPDGPAAAAFFPVRLVVVGRAK